MTNNPKQGSDSKHRFASIRFLTKQHKGALFLTLYLMVFMPLLILVLIYTRDETHIFINAFNSNWMDKLMKLWTYLGDGLVVAILLVLTLLYSVRMFFSVGMAYAFGGLGAQLLKKLVFQHFPRPTKYFEVHNIDVDLHLVEGVKLYGNFSFPSGHTATAFAVFFCLACFARARWIQALLFILAAGVAMSRVYLSQHFLMDVVGGSALGIILSWLSWNWMNQYKNDWLDKPVYKLRLP